jgi:hypothetical protein
LRAAMPDRALEDPTRQRHPHGKNTPRTRTCLVRTGSTTTVRAQQCVQEAAKGSGLQDGQPQRQGREYARVDAGSERSESPRERVGCLRGQTRKAGTERQCARAGASRTGKSKGFPEYGIRRWSQSAKLRKEAAGHDEA